MKEPVFKTGRVKFYRINRRHGFIIPDEGGPEVYFHRRAGSRVGEEKRGVLTLLSNTSIIRHPEEGDHVIYTLTDTPKKGRPEAHCMNLLSEWSKYLQIVRARPRPDCLPARIRDHGSSENGWQGRILWEGNTDLLLYAHASGNFDFEDTNLIIEVETVTGWQRGSRPKTWKRVLEDSIS